MCDNTKPTQCINPEMKLCQYCKYGICIYPEDIETSEDLDGCCFYTSCMYDFDKKEDKNMRDTNRIDRICGKLDVLWHEYPDQRLGQLIVNYLMNEENVFWQDDDVTESRLDSFLNKKNTAE